MQTIMLKQRLLFTAYYKMYVALSTLFFFFSNVVIITSKSEHSDAFALPKRYAFNQLVFY